MRPAQIDYAHLDAVVDTLHEAFGDYPVMRYVLGDEQDGFEKQHRRLVRLFVMGRVLNQDPLYGLGAANAPVAVATVTLPGPSKNSRELAEYRQAEWARLGAGAQERYEAFCDACAQFDVSEPHHHLNMLGVRRGHQGQGLGKKLVEHVIDLAEKDTGSGGVSLSTENASNLPFYNHLGFELTGHAEVGPGLETWNFFRPASARPAK
jgi:GNAT superfamily N-acetyltransferase